VLRLLSVRERKLAIGVVSAIALATVSGVRGMDLRARREQILQAGDRRAADLARMLTGYMRETLAATDAALRQLALHGRHIGGANAAAGEWLPPLQAGGVGLTGVGSISIVDRTGIIRHSTQPTMVGQSLRDQSVFTRLASDSSDGLVDGTPVRTVPGDGPFVIPLGRKLRTATGGVDGIVVASYFPDSLREFFRTVDVGRQGAVTVFSDAGLVLFSEPPEWSSLGPLATSSPLYAAAKRQGDSGYFRGRVRADAPMLRTAIRSLEPRLRIAVSLSEPELLANWSRDVRRSLTVGVFLIVAVAALLMLLYRQMDVRHAAEQALIRSQRLESLGQLTGGVAHDFNNLLTVVLGNVSLLKTVTAQGALVAQDESLGEIERAAKRAADLTRQLLAFARRQPLLPRVIDLATAIESAEPMLRRVLGDENTLELVTTKGEALANVDPVQIETTLLNLCINARDAMPNGGKLVIETGKATLDAQYARTVSDVAPGRYSVITVSDTGSGIPAEHLPRVFEPFFTTKRPGKGTGLGLSMVYGFVKQSGGHIKVSSEVGRGTSVRIYFPESTGTPAVSTPAPGDVPRGQGEVVLLVEDEPVVLGLAARLLTQLGYSVLEAKDGQAALALVKPDTRLDLLLTDVVLPGELSGPRIAEELRRMRPGLPVLFASGYSQEIIALGAQGGEDVRFLAKPYDRRKLAQAVHEALHPAVIRES
jgi:signal transduction histidine kinase/CheY-like chemotaxis protein